MKRKKRQRQLAAKSKLNLRITTLTISVVLVLTVVTFTVLTGTCYQKYTLTGAYAREYEGKILDKSQTITESWRGSGVRRRLLLEGRGGEKFEVAIGEETYERARKGMWIKKTEAGVELTWPMTQAAESPTPETQR